MKAMSGAVRNGWQQVRLLPQVIHGWFQPGLAKLVSRIVDRHLYSNLEFCAHRYPRLMRLARWAVHHPMLAPTIVALPYFAVLLLARYGWLHGFDLATDDQASVRDFWTVNIGVLAVQAALVGHKAW